MAQYIPMEGGDVQTPAYRAWSRFSASNRFFTEQSKVPHEILNSMGDTIDPRHILEERALNSKVPVVHIADNKVRYWERTDTEKDGKM